MKVSAALMKQELPEEDDLFAGPELARYLEALGEPQLTLLVVGDIMLGGRTRKRLAAFGDDYPFEGVLPLLQRAQIVVGNLEGVLASNKLPTSRNYSYGVSSRVAPAIARAGIHVLTLANNHLQDCGSEGVVKTLRTLTRAGLVPLGAGADRAAAHVPVIRTAAGLRVGLLGYYWNRRCAATDESPGSAMDEPDRLAADIRALRPHVDVVVSTHHWGIPYERVPSPEDRAKARLAIDCGADAVIGHHPHVIQPFEIYRDRPIFYSVGNFTFGSGNSSAEGLAIGLRFAPARVQVEVYPLYVKNRDPRVNYQPKLLRGQAATRTLARLVEVSGDSGSAMRIEASRGTLDLPRRSDG
jgi:poly-gamma-glutamate capsule biosynthesis protein CapA/YwtB (metallophosphatase superfamily)